MALDVQTLNQYLGTDKTGTGTTIVAEDMQTACQVYKDQLSEDPVIMQCTKTGVRTVLPVQLVSFRTSVSPDTAKITCEATPEAYTLAAGTKQIFTAKAGEGWEFSKWTIDGTDAEGDAVALLTIPAKESVVDIVAVFKAVT